MWVSPRYTDADWKAAFDGGKDWEKAIAIVENRIRGRWLDAADALLARAHSGFAIVAIDCIVIESLWGFRHGKCTPSDRAVYREVLTVPPFSWTNDESDEFRKSVRHGIMHDAETKGWLIQRTKPSGLRPETNDNGDRLLNRTRFHRALKITFDDWLARLRNGDEALRKNMRARMNQIIKNTNKTAAA